MIESNDLKIILFCPLQRFWSRSVTGLMKCTNETQFLPNCFVKMFQWGKCTECVCNDWNKSKMERM